MKMKRWMPFVMIGGMILVMASLMGMLSFMLGETNPLTMMNPSGENGISGMWRVMAISFLGLLLMSGLMFFLFRWMTGSKGSMSLMMGVREIDDFQWEQSNITKLTLNVPDVSCAHCKMKIEQEIGSLPGVDSVFVDVDTKLIEINLITPPTKTEIESFLSEIGYPPTIQ
jgi:copper chaperone CopZ